MVVIAPDGFERLPILDNPLRIPAGLSPVTEAFSRRIETSGAVQSAQTQRHPTSLLRRANGHAGLAEAASSELSSGGSILSIGILGASISEQDQESFEKHPKADLATVTRLYENTRRELGAKLTITA